jgi:thioredoxin 1
MIAPLYEELSEEFQGVVRFLKVDVDQNPDATANFQVDGWPTFLLVKNGEVQEEIVGGNAAKLGLYDMVVKYA